MIRVLFVDDEPNILHGLRRSMRPMRNEWDIEFAGSGEEALIILASAPFDAVVSDVRMPGMNGAQLLGEVRSRFPSTARLALSGEADQGTILSLAGNTHQYLSKPCEEDAVRKAIGSACSTCYVPSDSPVRKTILQAQSLPSDPKLFHKIVDGLQRSSAMTLGSTSYLILQDMAISLKILQFVNSAFFSTARTITSIVEAVGILGVETIESLVHSDGVISEFSVNYAEDSTVGDLWRHSSKTASMARSLAQLEKLSAESQQEAFTSGLFHDIGKLVFAQNYPGEYRTAMELAETESWMDWQAETQVFGISHAEIGGYLLSLWGLPATVVQAVATHHRQIVGQDGQLDNATFVCIANVLDRSGWNTREARLGRPVLDRYISELGLSGRMATWERLVAQPNEMQRAA